LLVVLGIAWLTESAGLSMAMGAFLAGLFIAETEFQQQIELDVRPYKRLLMGLFFMTVGMRMDPAFIVDNLAEMLFWAAGLVAIKAGLLYVVLKAFKYTRRTSAHTALLLAQGGEFGFIMFGLAATLGVLEGVLVQKLLVVITLTMAATPLLDMMGSQLERRWWRTVKRRKPEAIAEETQDISGHIIIAGYGRMGKMIANHLAEERIPFLALDSAPKEISAGRKAHHPVYFGDAARPDVLEALGISRAIVLVITLHDPDASEKLAILMRDRYPDLPILARTSDAKHANRLESRGVSAVPELQVAGMRMLSSLFALLGRPEEDIHRVMEQVRRVAG
jgi:CPA2 family monovalent cation:H+ antiporter-2